MFVKYHKIRENTLAWKRYRPVDEEGTPVKYIISIEYADGTGKNINYPSKEERDRILNDIDQMQNQPYPLLDITPGRQY